MAYVFHPDKPRALDKFIHALGISARCIGILLSCNYQCRYAQTSQRLLIGGSLLPSPQSSGCTTWVCLTHHIENVVYNFLVMGERAMTEHFWQQFCGVVLHAFTQEAIRCARAFMLAFLCFRSWKRGGQDYALNSIRIAAA